MGNFSRNTFDRLKHYVGVRLQQGVPLIDADWNEQEDIRKFELQAFLKWFAGNGVPSGNDGFRILAAAGTTNNFDIKGGNGTALGAGRILVEGMDAMLESTMRYSNQPLYNNPTLAAKWGVAVITPLTTPGGAREDLVYIDVWEREVDSSEDGNLINPAIGIACGSGANGRCAWPRAPSPCPLLRPAMVITPWPASSGRPAMPPSWPSTSRTSAPWASTLPIWRRKSSMPGA